MILCALRIRDTPLNRSIWAQRIFDARRRDQVVHLSTAMMSQPGPLSRTLAEGR
jgi:hypothetical protein